LWITFERKLLTLQKAPLVNDVYLEIARAQPPARKLQLVRRADLRREALRLEELAEQLELLDRRHILQIDDGNLRRALRLAPQVLAVRAQQHVEHEVAAVEFAQRVPLREAAHDG
jgi:hypothetical protein